MQARSDAELWQLSQGGDRRAFAEIVVRYQSLLCALAYSVIGSVARSEELAQETFLTAWQRLADVREPARLKSWLCGIVRNLSLNALRSESRRAAAEVAAPDAALSHGLADTQPEIAADDPMRRAMSEQESTLVWCTLSALPETYREPLVLFYRQGQSVSEVASALELTEEATKQRLSRGRQLLKSEVSALIERTLLRTAPSAAFTAGVLAALPALTPKSAAAAVLVRAVTGQAAIGGAKGLLGGMSVWPLVGPIIGLVIALLSSRAAAATARSKEERVFVLRRTWQMVVFAWLMSLGLAWVLSQTGSLYAATPLSIIVGVLLWTSVLVLSLLLLSRNVQREVVRIRERTKTADCDWGAAAGETTAHELRSRKTVLGIPLFHIVLSRRDLGQQRLTRAIGWLACGDMAISPLFAFGGVAIAPVAIGGVTIGLLSLSLLGIAVGVLAFGSIAFGQWAYGFAAAGWQSAAGVAVIAHDYALGVVAQAHEANTAAAQAWFAQQLFHAPVAVFAFALPWFLVLMALIAIARSASRRLRRRSR